MKALLTVAEVARLLRLHPTQVYKLAAERQLPSFKIPGVGVRFAEDEILRWVENGRREEETRPARRRP